MKFRNIHEANSHIRILEEELELASRQITQLAAHCLTLQQQLASYDDPLTKLLIAEVPRNIELLCEIRDDPEAPLYLRLLVAIDLLDRSPGCAANSGIVHDVLHDLLQSLPDKETHE
jgi:hypothetical protein